MSVGDYFISTGSISSANVGSTNNISSGWGGTGTVTWDSTTFSPYVAAPVESPVPANVSYQLVYQVAPEPSELDRVAAELGLTAGEAAERLRALLAKPSADPSVSRLRRRIFVR